MQCGCGKLIGWRMGGKCLACRYREAKMKRRTIGNESVIPEERKSEAPKVGLRCNPARLRKPLLPPTKDRAKTVKEEPDIMYEETYHGFMQEPERYASHGEFGRLNNPRAYSEEDLEVIREMTAEGATNTAIGMKLGRNPAAIKQKIQSMKRLGDL